MRKHRGFGFLIKWLIYLCDIILISGIYFLICYWLEPSGESFFFKEFKHVELLLILSYSFALYFLPIKIHIPVIHVDKVVERSLSTVLLFAILLITGLFFLYQQEFSIQLILYYILALSFILPCWHICVRKMLTTYRKSGHNFKHVVIVGAGECGQELLAELKTELTSGYRVLGFFDDNPSSKNNVGELYLGKVSELEDFVLEKDVDNVYCTLPYSEQDTIVQTMNFCEKNMVRFYLVPEYFLFIKKSLILEPIISVPIMAIRPEPLQYIHNRLVKRCLDVVFSLFILVTIYPVLYVIAGTLIKLSSPGPVYFKQLRTGIYGKNFYCYKFRSMRPNGEAHTKQAEKNDPRITKIGAFLRKTNLDEMPQFINVLKGEMSIVGPRPHMLNHTKEYSSLIDKYMVRHLVKPGITGWAQITGYRGEISDISQMEERVKRDVWYIENWNFFFDLKIIAMTALSMLKKERENAY